jgi:hypothetical protein
MRVPRRGLSHRKGVNFCHFVEGERDRPPLGELPTESMVLVKWLQSFKLGAV